MEEELKRIKNKRKLEKKQKKNDNYLNIMILKILITSIITITLLILSKSSNMLDKNIKKIIFENNINFNKYMNKYVKYFSEFIPFENLFKSEMTFDEKLKYNSKNKYLDGVKLEVENNYLVPALESGLVVYIGEKENYGNVVIVQQINGVDIWYGNLNKIAVDLYDYIEKGSLIGDTTNNSLYIVLEKEGKYLNYEEYI